MKLLVFLLALLFVVHSVCLVSAKTERYVRSNASTACPVKSCLTLNEYANDSEKYFTSDTSFVFLDGEHYLDSALWVRNKTNISMRGANVNVTIVLLSNAYFKFTESQEFVLNSLIIHFHGFHSDEGLRFSSALIIENCQSFALSNLKFSRYPGAEGLSRAIFLQQSTVDITNSSVSNCKGVSQGSAIYASRSTINFFGSNYFSRNQVLYNGTQGGLHRGGRGGGRPPNLSIGGASPPQLWATIQRGAYKSPLLSLFCNSVYWLKPHNNVNSRPPNLAVLPPPLGHYLLIAQVCSSMVLPSLMGMKVSVSMCLVERFS